MSVLKMTTTELLAYWIVQREEMRKRKEGGFDPVWSYGWHGDPCMGRVRYCNVRREDDKVTRWLAQHWRPQHNEVWQIVLARMVNYIPTLEAITQYPLTIESASTIMKGRRAAGEKIWTSAYTISTCGKSMDKVDYVMGVVQTVRDKWTAPIVSDLSTWHRRMTLVDGLGSFLAAQVVADLKNTQGHILASAPDWYTWSSHGPGSLKGLSEFFGKTVTPRMYHEHLAECWRLVRPHLPVELQDLHMQDFQNCMCEFSKFMRVRRGGHVRNTYTAG